MANDYGIAPNDTRHTRPNMKKGEKRHKRTSKSKEADLYYRRTDGFHRDNNNNYNSNGIPGGHNHSYSEDIHSEMSHKPLALHRPRVPRKKDKDSGRASDLNSSFDPIKDRHMWTMWRTAVNGRIVDEVRRLEKAKSEPPPPTPQHANGKYFSKGSSLSYHVPLPYGKALSGAPPLSRFIRLDDHSKHVAQSLVREGQGQLKTSQFIYYGLPRVMVNGDRVTAHESNPAHHHHYST